MANEKFGLKCIEKERKKQEILRLKEEKLLKRKENEEKKLLNKQNKEANELILNVEF